MKHDSYGIIKLYNSLLAFRNTNTQARNQICDKNAYEEREQDSDHAPKKRANWKKKKRVVFASALLSFIILWWRKKLKGRLLTKPFIHYVLRGSSSDEDNHRNAVETPLSLLLVAAKKGLITKAMINNNTIAYKLREQLSETTGGKMVSKTWKKSLFPKDNASLLKEIMNDLAEGGCLDVSVLPESLLSRMGPVFVTAFPFIYLFFLYHMLKRLQNGQNNIDNAGVDFQNEGFERTTFADVAGIDTAQVELQEIVSYLSNPKPFLGLGALPPKGLLLHGKPGLGKVSMTVFYIH